MSTLATPSGSEISSTLPLDKTISKEVQTQECQTQRKVTLNDKSEAEFRPDDGDDVAEVVVGHNLLGVVHDGRHVHTDHHLGPSLRGGGGMEART